MFCSCVFTLSTLCFVGFSLLFGVSFVRMCISPARVHFTASNSLKISRIVFLNIYNFHLLTVDLCIVLFWLVLLRCENGYIVRVYGIFVW